MFGLCSWDRLYPLRTTSWAQRNSWWSKYNNRMSSTVKLLLTYGGNFLGPYESEGTRSVTLCGYFENCSETFVPVHMHPRIQCSSMLWEPWPYWKGFYSIVPVGAEKPTVSTFEKKVLLRELCGPQRDHPEQLWNEAFDLLNLNWSDSKHRSFVCENAVRKLFKQERLWSLCWDRYLQAVIIANGFSILAADSSSSSRFSC